MLDFLKRSYAKKRTPLKQENTGWKEEGEKVVNNSILIDKPLIWKKNCVSILIIVTQLIKLIINIEEGYECLGRVRGKKEKKKKNLVNEMKNSRWQE